MSAAGPVAPRDPERRHPVLRNVLLTVFAVVIGAWTWAVLWVIPAPQASRLVPSSAADWLMWLDAAVGVLACIALWRRHRRPVALAVGLAMVSPVFGSATGAAMVLFVSVAASRRLVWVVWLGAINALAGVGIVLLYLPQSGPLELMLMIATGLAGQAALVGLGLWLRARRQLIASLRERAERAEAEREQALETARLGERTRIAREMHDVLAHRISLVSMHAGALEYRGGVSEEEARAAAGVIREHATLALQDLREVIGVLRDGPTGADGDGARPERPQPTLRDLPDLVSQSREAGVDVRLHADVTAEPPATAGRTAFRVVQEGLTNARKHGGAGPVDVTVTARRGEEILVAVTNPLRDSRDGPAVPVPGSGTGLTGLAERIRLAGGRLEHGVVGAAFRLRAWLPWEEGAR